MEINNEKLASIALEIVSANGAQTGHVRIAKHDNRSVVLRDGQVENVVSDTAIALSVRVVHHGSWGFAATTDLTTTGVTQAANQALQMAKISSSVSTDPVQMAAEPVYGKVSWRLPVEIDPMQVSDAEVIDLLKSWHHKVARNQIVHHVDVQASMGKDQTYFADLLGNQITQERDRVSGQLSTAHISDNGFDDMRTCAPPAGRGFEYLLGKGWDWDNELALLPEFLDEKTKSP